MHNDNNARYVLSSSTSSFHRSKIKPLSLFDELNQCQRDVIKKLNERQRTKNSLGERYG